MSNSVQRKTSASGLWTCFLIAAGMLILGTPSASPNEPTAAGGGASKAGSPIGSAQVASRAAGQAPDQVLAESPLYHYVSPDGLPSNDGGRKSPWDLQTALNHPPTVKPGHTIWMRGGIYRGSFVSKLAGTPEAVITVRQYPNERATLDGNPEENLNPGLHVQGSWVHYWGFEVMNSSPVRSLDQAMTPLATLRGNAGVVTDSPNVKFINLVVHDNIVGFGVWGGASDTEIYGCLIYNNGYDAPDRGHGHGIYTQNAKGERKLIDNILFQQFSHGIHAYGSGAAALNNVRVVGNTSFNNGAISKSKSGRNILVGGGGITKDPVVTDNCTYFPPKWPGDNNFGLGGGCENMQAHNNYFVGDFYPLVLSAWAPGKPSNCKGSLTNNTLVGAVDEAFKTEYNQNTYRDGRPSAGTSVFVRPNQYETGRANITIYNWRKEAAVKVDLSKCGLKNGDRFEVRDAQDFFGAPATAGTYDGNAVSIPMTGKAIAQPMGSGFVAPTHTDLEFGVFVVLPGKNEFLQPAIQKPTPPGTGTGLKGEYFESNGRELGDPKLTNLKATRIDPTIDFVWRNGTPDTVASDVFCARWTGQIEARYTGTHWFFPESDKGARLWVDGQLLFDRWSIYPIAANEKPIQLKAGQKYSIRMEYFGVKGSPRARLRWSSPDHPKEVIPATQFYPAARP